MSKEQFDFSKPDEEGGDQGQFNALPEEAQETLISKAQKEAEDMDSSIEEESRKEIIEARNMGVGHELVAEGVLNKEDLELLYNEKFNFDVHRFGDGGSKAEEVQIKVLNRVIEQMVKNAGVETGNEIRVIFGKEKGGWRNYALTNVESNGCINVQNYEGSSFSLNANQILSIEKLER